MRHYFGRMTPAQRRKFYTKDGTPFDKKTTTMKKTPKKSQKRDLLDAIRRKAYEYELCLEGVKTAPYIQKPKKYKNILVNPSALRDLKEIERD